VKDNQPFVTKVCHQFLDSSDRIWVIHENEPTHDCVKRPIELHFRRVGFQESHIPRPSRLSALSCQSHGGGGAVDTDDLASFPDQFSNQKGYITAAAADVKHAHACSNSRLLK
jgi:hypothetical protein